MEKEKVINILVDSFDNNPSVDFVLDPKKDRNKILKKLANYIYKTAKLRDAIYISSDDNGIAIVYNANTFKEGFKDYWNQLLLTFQVIGISRVIKVLKREFYVKSIRPKDGRYLYFWFFGVSKKSRGKGASFELKNKIFELAIKEKLPIYAETSIPLNKKVYERFGFKTYHHWDGQGERLYFMKKEFK